MFSQHTAAVLFLCIVINFTKLPTVNAATSSIVVKSTSTSTVAPAPKQTSTLNPTSTKPTTTNKATTSIKVQTTAATVQSTCIPKCLAQIGENNELDGFLWPTDRILYNVTVATAYLAVDASKKTTSTVKVVGRPNLSGAFKDLAGGLGIKYHDLDLFTHGTSRATHSIFGTVTWPTPAVVISRVEVNGCGPQTLVPIPSQSQTWRIDPNDKSYTKHMEPNPGPPYAGITGYDVAPATILKGFPALSMCRSLSLFGPPRVLVPVTTLTETVISTTKRPGPAVTTPSPVVVRISTSIRIKILPIGSVTYTAPPSGDFILGGQTVSNGATVTIMSTVYTAPETGTTIIGGTTLTENAVATVGTIVVSRPPGTAEMVVDSSTVQVVQQTITTIKESEVAGKTGSVDGPGQTLISSGRSGKLATETLWTSCLVLVSVLLMEVM